MLTANNMIRWAAVTLVGYALLHDTHRMYRLRRTHRITHTRQKNMRQSMRLAAKQQRAAAEKAAPPFSTSAAPAPTPTQQEQPSKQQRPSRATAKNPTSPSTAAAPAPASTQQKQQPSKTPVAVAEKTRAPVAAARLPPPPPSSGPLPSFTFKRVPSASVTLASAAAPPIVLGSTSSSSAAPGGVAPVRAQEAQRKWTKSIKAQEAEATGGVGGADHEEEEEEGPFDNDASLSECRACAFRCIPRRPPLTLRHNTHCTDMAGLGSNEDVDVFVSALGVAEEEDLASYYASVTPLVNAYAGGALPSFADATTSHIPVLSGKEAAVVDWKGSGPGLAAVRSICDLIQAHEAGGNVNFAHLAVVRGRMEATVPSGAHLNAGSSAYILCLGSQEVSLSLELPAEDKPLRLLLPPGAMVKFGPATATAVTRTALAPLVKECAGEGSGANDKALVLFLYDTARLREVLTGKVVSRAPGLAWAAPTVSPAKKRKAAGPPFKKKGKAAKGKSKKEEDADQGGEDASDKENEGPKQDTAAAAAVATTAAAGANIKKNPAQPKQAPAMKGKDARLKALRSVSANAAKGAAEKARK